MCVFVAHVSRAFSRECSLRPLFQQDRRWLKKGALVGKVSERESSLRGERGRRKAGRDRDWRRHSSRCQSSGSMSARCAFVFVVVCRVFLLPAFHEACRTFCARIRRGREEFGASVAGFCVSQLVSLCLTLRAGNAARGFLCSCKTRRCSEGQAGGAPPK